MIGTEELSPTGVVLHNVLPMSFPPAAVKTWEGELLVWQSCLGVNELMRPPSINHSSGLLFPETLSVASEDVITIELLA